MEQFENRIKQAMQIEDELKRQESIKNILMDMITFFNGKHFTEKVKNICDLDFESFKQKLEFFIDVTMCKEDNYYFQTYTKEIFPYCFDQCTQKREGLALNLKDEFLNLIKNDIEFQKKYVDFFKQVHFKSYAVQAYLDEILKLPMFKEYVLTDEKFISNQLSMIYDFFDNLPKEYGYLISLYDKKNMEDIYNLYKKYFGDILTNEQLNELILLQLQINQDTNIFRIDDNERKSKLTFVLKSVINDKKIYNDIKSLQENTGLDFKLIITFAQKYYNTELYKNILNKRNFDSTMLDKIEYLANENIIEDTNQYKDIDKIEIEELMDAPKHIRTEIKPHLQGGPQSKLDNIKFFQNSKSEREFRIIYKDGKTEIKSLDKYNDDHIYVLGDIFKRKVKNIKEDDMAIELALKAADEIGAITYMIENEQCTIFLPSDLSKLQKKVSINWLNSAIPNGKIGIYVFYRNLKENYYSNPENRLKEKQILDFCSPLNDGEVMGRRQAAESILYLGERLTEKKSEKNFVRHGERKGKDSEDDAR